MADVPESIQQAPQAAKNFLTKEVGFGKFKLPIWGLAVVGVVGFLIWRKLQADTAAQTTTDAQAAGTYGGQYATVGAGSGGGGSDSLPSNGSAGEGNGKDKKSGDKKDKKTPTKKSPGKTFAPSKDKGAPAAKKPAPAAPHYTPPPKVSYSPPKPAPKPKPKPKTTVGGGGQGWRVQ